MIMLTIEHNALISMSICSGRYNVHACPCAHLGGDVTGHAQLHLESLVLHVYAILPERSERSDTSAGTHHDDGDTRVFGHAEGVGLADKAWYHLPQVHFVQPCGTHPIVTRTQTICKCVGKVCGLNKSYAHTWLHYCSKLRAKILLFGYSSNRSCRSSNIVLSSYELRDERRYAILHAGDCESGMQWVSIHRCVNVVGTKHVLHEAH